MDELTGLVLAGGRSRRMGADKALLVLEGRPLVVQVAQRLATVCGQVLIAPGGRPLPDLPWTVVADHVADAGPLAGIIGGLAATRTPLLAVVGVDTPDVPPGVHRMLARHWDGVAPAVVARRGQRVEPLVAVYATAALPALTKLFDAGERSPTRALAQLGATVVDVPAGAGWGTNLNTPEDLARFRARRSGSMVDRTTDYPAAGMATPPGPTVDATTIWFRLRPAADGVDSVRLCQQITRPRVGAQLRRTDGGQLWETRIARPAVDRLEYQYELEFADGHRELTIDPHNPLRAPGPFGDKSVVELPTYRPPPWLERGGPVRGRFLKLCVTSDHLATSMDIGLWASDGLDVEQEAPLVIAHDGPEYDRYSGLLRCCAAMVAAGRMPPLRVALLPPVDRNEHYAASPAYARALARELVPLLDWLAPQPAPRRDGRPWRIGMGASLGALATLHAHRRYPDLFGGLFLQSGSFFQRDIDQQESTFFRFDRITTFVDAVLAQQTWRRPVPVTMTCGTVEENLANNRRVRDALLLQGYDVRFAARRDGHNWVAWRDALDPHLVDLVGRGLA